MTTEIISSHVVEDMIFSADLNEALSQATEAAREGSKACGWEEAFFYVEDQHGRSVQKVDVVRDTLSDGSFAYTIKITFGGDQ